MGIILHTKKSKRFPAVIFRINNYTENGIYCNIIAWIPYYFQNKDASAGSKLCMNKSILTVIKAVLNFFSRIATVLCNNTEGLFVNTGQP